jgi:hypothetical protein
VFDKGTGRSLDEPSKYAVLSVRQIGYLFKKINLPCSSGRIRKAIRSYVQTDDDLKRHIFDRDYENLFEAVSRVVVSTVFPGPIGEGDLLPHHGPGSTMEKLTGNRKYDPRRFSWYRRLTRCFSKGLTIFPSEEHYRDSSDAADSTSLEEPSVRVVHVPKTLKTPRIIALEPVVMQMTQQSIKDFMVEKIEESPLTGGHVNFTDQSINQRLALQASRDRRLATLDLTAASDRVHNNLVRKLLAVNPELSCFVQSTRSPLANVEGQILPLAKFASMGSALCFPIEALTFFVICLVGRLVAEQGAPPFTVDAKTLLRLSKDIYVYGDDLIVPTNEVDSIIAALTQYGLAVSRGKSFSNCSFRESCGMDAFDGMNITPIYLRNPIPDGKWGALSIVSSVATANQLFANGLMQSYSFLRNEVEQQTGVLPSVTDRCGGLGWVDYADFGKVRHNRNLQRLEVQTLVPSISLRSDKIDGVPALHKCLLNLERKSRSSGNQNNDYPMSTPELVYQQALSADEEHLCRTPVRGALTLKRRWVPR